MWPATSPATGDESGAAKPTSSDAPRAAAAQLHDPLFPADASRGTGPDLSTLLVSIFDRLQSIDGQLQQHGSYLMHLDRRLDQTMERGQPSTSMTNADLAAVAWPKPALLQQQSPAAPAASAAIPAPKCPRGMHRSQTTQLTGAASWTKVRGDHEVNVARKRQLKRLSTIQNSLIFGESSTMGQAPAQDTNDSGHGRGLTRRLATPKGATCACVLMPDSAFRTAWDTISVMLIVFVAISLPYRIAFTGSTLVTASTVVEHSPAAPEAPSDAVSGLAIIDFVVDVFFLIDICLNFRSAYVESSTGRLVANSREIALNYLRTWFALDAIASFPFDWTISGISFKAEARGSEPALAGLPAMLRILKLFKLLRLMRIARLAHLLGRIEHAAMRAVNGQTIRLAGIVLLLMMVAHWDGCLQFIVASLDSELDPATGEMVVASQTWIVRAGLVGMSPSERWAWSFYHAMTQLLAISTGIVPPERQPEMWIYLVSLLMGASLYAIFVASITSIFAESFASSRMYRSKLDELRNFVKQTHMTKALSKKLHAHFELAYPGHAMYDEDGLTSALSPPLRGEVRLHKFQRVLESLQVLSNARLSRAVASVLERQVYVHDDTIIWHGEKGNGLYFIAGGCVEVLIPKAIEEEMKRRVSSAGEGDVLSRLTAVRREEGGIAGCVTEMRTHDYRTHVGMGPESRSSSGHPPEDVKVVTQLTTPSFFGEMALLNKGGTAVASARVVGFCEAYHLSTEAYEALLVSFPTFKSYIEAVARLRLESMAGAMNTVDESPPKSPPSRRISASFRRKSAQSGASGGSPQNGSPNSSPAMTRPGSAAVGFNSESPDPTLLQV